MFRYVVFERYKTVDHNVHASNDGKFTFCGLDMHYTTEYNRHYNILDSKSTTVKYVLSNIFDRKDYCPECLKFIEQDLVTLKL